MGKTNNSFEVAQGLHPIRPLNGSDIREPRYKVTILAAPIIPLSRGPTVYAKANTTIQLSFCSVYHLYLVNV